MCLGNFKFLPDLHLEILRPAEEISRHDLIFGFLFYSMKVIVMDLDIIYLISYFHSFLL